MPSSSLKSHSSLYSLARTLAERLMNEMGYCQPEERCEICQSRIIQAEAVIHEAIEKTLESAEQAISVTHIQPPEDGTNSSQVIIARRTHLAAIRSLKPVAIQKP